MSKFWTERPKRPSVPAAERPMSRQEYDEMFRYNFDTWHKLVFEAIKSCEGEKCPLVFVISSHPRIKEAEIKILACFPKLKFRIEKENDSKFE